MSPANDVHTEKTHMTDHSFKSNVLFLRTSDQESESNCSSTPTTPSSSLDEGRSSSTSPVDSLVSTVINDLTGAQVVEGESNSPKIVKCPQPPLARPRISKIRIGQVSQSVTQIECNTRDHLAKKVASSNHEAQQHVAGNINANLEQQLPLTSVIRASNSVDVKPDTKQITLIHCKVDPVMDLSVDGKEGTVSLIPSSIIVTTPGKEQGKRINGRFICGTQATATPMSTRTSLTRSTCNAPPGDASGCIPAVVESNESSAGGEDINNHRTNQLLSPQLQVPQLQAQISTACVTQSAIESPSCTVKLPANNNVTTGDLKKQSNCTLVPCNSHTSSNTLPSQCEEAPWAEKSIHIQGQVTTATTDRESFDGPLNCQTEKCTNASVERLHGTLNSSSHLSHPLVNPLPGHKKDHQINYIYSQGVPCTPPPNESESSLSQKSNDHHQLPHSGKAFISTTATTTTFKVTTVTPTTAASASTFSPVNGGKSGANYSSESKSKMSHQLPSPSTARKSPAPTHQLSCNNSYPDDLNPFDEEDVEDKEPTSECNQRGNTTQQYANGSPCNSTKFNTQMSLNANSIQLQQQQTSAVASSKNIQNTDARENVFGDENVRKENSVSGNFGPTSHLIGKSNTSSTTIPSMATPTPKPRSLRGTGSIRKSPELEFSSLKSNASELSSPHHQDFRSKVQGATHTTTGPVYPDDLNPFGDDEEEANEQENKRLASLNNSTRSSNSNSHGRVEGKAAYGCKSQVDYDESLNPFGDDEEEDENVQVRSHSTPSSNATSFTRSLTNDQSPVNPVPKPRKSLYVNTVNSDSRQLSPSLLRKGTPGQPSPGRGSYRMSRPNVPPPPAPGDVLKCINGNSTVTSPNSPSNEGRRKKPPAPKPPSPSNVKNSSNVTLNASLSSSLANSTANLDANSVHSICSNSSPISTPRTSDRRFSSANVSTNNESDSATPVPIKVPRKKRPAPEPPKAIRRNVIGSLESIEKNLDEIGDRLVEITKEFELLDEYFTNNPLNDAANESSDAESKIYKYLELARERCTLARKQEELGLARREHKLEEQHADLEFSIREIELLPKFKKTTEQEAQSQELLTKLIEVIDQRNEVVENMTKINKRYVICICICEKNVFIETISYWFKMVFRSMSYFQFCIKSNSYSS